PIIGVLALQVVLGCESDGEKERLVWKYETYNRGWLSGDCQCPAPVLAADTLYFCGGYFGEKKERLVAVDLLTRSEKWKVTMPGSCGPLTVKEGVIYKWDGKALAAFDARTGTRLWDRSDATGLPLFYKENVYTFIQDGPALEKLERATGKPLDSLRVPGIPSGKPVLEQAMLYYGTMNGDIATVNLETGAQVAAVKVADRITTPLAKQGDVVFFSAEKVDPQTKVHQFNFYALEVGSRKVKWTVTGRVLTQAEPLVWNNTVFFGGGSLHAIHVESGQGRTYDLSGGPVWQPIISEGILYVGGGRYMHAVDPSSGKILWRYRTGGWVAAPPTGPPPVVRDGLLYFGSLDCNVYALRL
ncbi:MAG: PQQ-binding-like beta-propeller repeat protein, partial [Candidatus Methylomirabilis sp.]